MAVCQSTPSACAAAQRDDVRTIVELDRRRASVGLHIASDPTRPSRTSASLWLDPSAAEKLAEEILAAVRAHKADQEAIAWTVTQGGRAHG